MIHKSGRRISPKDNWRHHSMKLYQFHVSKFLKENRQSILTSVLLFVLFGLLVVISSRLRSPNISKPPPDVSIIGYNIFVSQVKANNVLTVTIQGDHITGDLKRSLQDKLCLHYQTDISSMHSHLSSADEYNLSYTEENVTLTYFTYSMSVPHYMSSPTMATMIDTEVQCIINEGYDTAYKLLTEHYTQLTKLAQALLEHEQLNRIEFEALLRE